MFSGGGGSPNSDGDLGGCTKFWRGLGDAPNFDGVLGGAPNSDLGSD